MTKKIMRLFMIVTAKVKVSVEKSINGMNYMKKISKNSCLFLSNRSESDYSGV